MNEQVTQKSGQRYKVAALQMVSGTDVDANLAMAARLIAKAVAQGARLVVLPEFFAIMGLTEHDKVLIREAPGQGKIQQFLADTAKQHAIWLVGGAIPLQASVEDKVLNSCLVFDDQGRQVAHYDKIHLFNLALGGECYNEANTIEAGKQVVVVDSPFGRIGLAICYDLRFPELFRAMEDVDIIVLPAAFTLTTGRVHWEVLVRARAIENLAYMIASAQGGKHQNQRETYGHSMVVDPWGLVLNSLETGPGVVIAEIDPAYQHSLRQSLPALAHRQLT